MSEEYIEEINQMVIMCNRDDADSVMGALVMGAAAATGEQVMMFFQPGGAKALVKEEKISRSAGLPDPLSLNESIQILDGRIILCELGLPNKDIKEEDLREGVKVKMASPFLLETENARAVYCY